MVRHAFEIPFSLYFRKKEAEEAREKEVYGNACQQLTKATARGKEKRKVKKECKEGSHKICT